MLDLQSSHMFIRTSFLGILKTSILKDYHNLLFRIEIIKILTPDVRLISMVEKSCLEDHGKADTLKLVSSEIAYIKTFNYTEIEYYRNYLYSIINHPKFKEDINGIETWNCEFRFANDINHFVVSLASLNVQRLFAHVNSFYSNYLVLSAMIKYSGLEKAETPPKIIEPEKKITEYINNEIKIEQPVMVPIDNDRTEIDNIFEMCLSSSTIKMSLIHYTLNYFQYINEEQCMIQFSNNDPNQILIMTPLIIPSNFNMDENYFKSLIITSPLPTNTIQFIIKKILGYFLANSVKYQKQPIYIMMLSYLLFIYLLRYLYDSNRDVFRDYFSKLICIPSIQKSLFTKLINSTFAEFNGKIFFDIKDIDSLSNKKENNEIKKISSQYKHLIPISQEDFADKVFIELKETKSKYPKTFKLNSKKFINILEYINDPNNIQQKNIHKKQDSVFFDPEKTIDNTLLDKSEFEYSYLDYNIIDNQPKIISRSYQEMINYARNNSSILLLKNDIVPKEVINLFSTLINKVLNRDVLTKENISTFNYYEELVNHINDPSLFRHSTLMFIVFQIMIPFHYDMYGTTQFQDCFL